jgi:hypothetical protein
MRQLFTVLAVMILAAVTSAQASPAESSIELVSRFWREVWNAPYRMETIDEMLIEDFTITTDGKDVRGRDAFKKWVQGFQAKVKDLKVVPLEMMATADGKRVITRMVATGKNNGMFGTAPDNAPVEFVAISIMEVKDGKLAHNWVERSAFELHQRLTKAK